MIRATLLCVALICAPLVASADAALTRLYDLIAIDDYLTIVRAEGLDAVDELSNDMLGRAPDAALLERMETVYDPQRMAEIVRSALNEHMSDHHLSRAVAFFSDPAMQHVIELEVAARQAIADPAVENVATIAWLEAEETRPWLVARIEDIWQSNDLLERNVAGALNANLHFYKGLALGQAIEMTETDMLSEVWSQEAEIRADTELWLGAYLTMSYDPVPQDALETYAKFWHTETGKALNRAIFDAFDQIYTEISYATGQVLALSLATQDL